MRKQSTFICAYCGSTYSVRRGSSKHCSRPCALRNRVQPSMEERLWSKVNKTDTCWLWTGHLDKDGYGVLNIKTVPTRAHRLSYEATYGPIPDGMIICHRCPGDDRRECINPEHLYLGTPADNAQDMVTKGRRPVGSANQMAKLSEADVIEIRRLVLVEGRVQRHIAARFKVAPSAICNIVNRKLWKHVA